MVCVMFSRSSFASFTVVSRTCCKLELADRGTPRLEGKRDMSKSYPVSAACVRSFSASFCEIFSRLVYISIRSGIVANNLTLRPQLELGAGATAFETPKAVQTCAVGGYVLRGILVSKNGNYTDGNGQMWLTDEIDLVNRRLIRRVANASAKTSDLTAISTVLMLTTCLCDKFRNRIPQVVCSVQSTKTHKIQENLTITQLKSLPSGMHQRGGFICHKFSLSFLHLFIRTYALNHEHVTEKYTAKK